MKERLRSIAVVAGYVFFYFVAFAVSSYFAFPYEKVRDRLVAWFATTQPVGKGARIEIEELTPYRFTGVRATGVRYISPNPPEAGQEKPPTVVEIEELRFRFGIFSRIFGKWRVPFYAHAFNGELEGELVDASTERTLELDLTDVEMGRIEPIEAMVGLPIAGQAKGHVELTLPDKRASKANGSIKLTVSDLAAGDGKAKIRNLLALPRVNAGELTIDADVKDGTLKINQLSAKGTDLEFIAEGKVTLRDQMTDSNADLYARFKFSDAYRGKNEMTKTLFGAPGSTIPAAFELDQKVKQSKRADGFYGWHMTGMLTAMRSDPFAGAVPGSPTPTPGATTTPTSTGGGKRGGALTPPAATSAAP